MKNIIKKVLKEDFDWLEDEETNLPPINEINEWCEQNKTQISKWIQQIDEFYRKSPQIKWGDESDFNDDNVMVALSVKGVGDELRNIYSSIETISDEVDFIKNPNMYDD